MIDENKICICGSGKKLKDCCVNNKMNIEVIGKNYKNESIIIDKDKNKEIYYEVEDFIGKNLKDYSLLSSDQGIEYLEKLYSYSNSFLRKLETTASCKKGCDDCCNRLVLCTPIEAEYIRRYVNNYFSQRRQKEILTSYQKIQHALPSFIELYNLKFKEKIEKNIHKEKISCVFLDENKRCSVYTVRPYACRSHLVFSHPDKCQRGEKTHKYTSIVTELIEGGINKLSSKVYPYYAFSRDPIAKPISRWFAIGFDKI